MLAVSSGYADEPGRFSGFLDGYYDKLQPGPKDGVKQRWLKPGTDFTRYNWIMLDSVVFFLAEDSYKGIDPQDLKELADGLNKEVVAVFPNRSKFVAQPGPGVVRLRFAITGLKQSNPGRSAISTVLPVGLAVNLVKKGAGGSWSGSGATSMEVMAIDTMTNEVIAVGMDDRTAGFTERFSKWGSTQEAFKFWARQIKTFVDDTKAIKDNPPPK